MKRLTELLTYRALHVKLASQATSDHFVDLMVESGSEDDMKGVQLKNVCAKLSVQLADRLDKTTDFLGISKRRFIEAAIIEALDEASRVMNEINISDIPDAIGS